MESIDVCKPRSAGHESQVCAPYVPPRPNLLSLAAAKGLFLRHADPRDLKVQHIFECVDELFGENGS
jgi:hypothetical protein